MSTRPRQPDNVPLLSPFPEGWYFLTTRKTLKKENLIQMTWMGENVVAWIDERGKVCAADAYCPHLGADLGPSTGGQVCEGRLICPFHGYEFDTTGQCVATPYADPPKTAKLKVFPTRDINGLIFAWWGIDGREPQWGLPLELPEQDGWSGIKIRTIRFPGHPQETTENSVDVAHLRYVHGYGSVGRVDPLLIEGHKITSAFEFKTVREITKFAKLTFDIVAHVNIYGLGYSYVEIHERSIGLDLRLWILATPVDGTLIDLSLVSQVREIRKPKRWILGMGFLPTRLRTPIMNNFMSLQQVQDVKQDVIIWRAKEYRSRPRLCRSDGEIMPYRYYCAQFYPSE